MHSLLSVLPDDVLQREPQRQSVQRVRGREIQKHDRLGRVHVLRVRNVLVCRPRIMLALSRQNKFARFELGAEQLHLQRRLFWTEWGAMHSVSGREIQEYSRKRAMHELQRGLVLGHCRRHDVHAVSIEQRQFKPWKHVSTVSLSYRLSDRQRHRDEAKTPGARICISFSLSIRTEPSR